MNAVLRETAKADTSNASVRYNPTLAMFGICGRLVASVEKVIHDCVG